VFFFSLESTFWVGKNSLRCWRKLVLRDVEEVKGQTDTEDGSGYTSSQMEVVTGHSVDNCVDKMSCDSTTETGDENIFDGGKLLEQNSQKLPVECKAFSSVKLECESSSASLSSVDTVQMTTRSRSRINSKSDNEQTYGNKLETHSSKSLPQLSCDNSVNNSPVRSCGGRRNVKALSPRLRRTVLSDTDDVNGGTQAEEMKVSSTVKRGCEKSQNLGTNLVCSDNSVSSSHEMSASRMSDNEMALSGNSFQRQEVGVLKKQFIKSDKSSSETSISRICTRNSVKALRPKSRCIRTPGFGNDIIQSVEEVAMHEKFGENLNEQPQDITCKSEDIVQETMEDSAVKTGSYVLSGDVAVSNVDNGQQVEGQKQDCNVLGKDYDEEEEDEEGFNDDIICTHGKLNCKVLIIIISFLKILTVIAWHAFGDMMRILCFSDMMLHLGVIVFDYPVTVHHFPEEQNSQLHCYSTPDLVSMIRMAIST